MLERAYSTKLTVLLQGYKIIPLLEVCFVVLSHAKLEIVAIGKKFCALSLLSLLNVFCVCNRCYRYLKAEIVANCS